MKKYTVDYKLNPFTNEYEYEIREYRNPDNVIARGKLPCDGMRGMDFKSVREYIICYGLDNYETR